MSKNFHENLRFSGLVVFEKIFKITPLYFCDYLPFEEDLALYLNNFEFPLSMDDLY
jgi:hypothetical protein